MAKLIKQEHGGAINRFEPGESGNPNGRPPKVFSALSKEWKERGFEPATPTRVREVYEYLLALPLQEVIEIAGSPKQPGEMDDYPALVRLVAKEMIGKNGREMLKEMIDRAHGRPKQAVDFTSAGNEIGKFTGFDFLKPLTDEDEGSEEPPAKPGK